MFWGEVNVSQESSLLDEFRVFPFSFGSLILGFAFASSPLIPTSAPGYNEACQMLCNGLTQKLLLVSATVFFNAVYSPVNSLCKNLTEKYIYYTVNTCDDTLYYFAFL